MSDRATTLPPPAGRITVHTREVPPVALLAWQGGLACFLLAAATGALFRFGMVGDLPGGLRFDHVRHAHSHLAYFGWATPVLMGLIAARLPDRRRVAFRPIVAATLVAALLAYPPFLLSGYEPTVIAGRAVPLSVVAAALNTVAWYAFAVAYWRATRDAQRDRALRLWDAAIVFLLLASGGALGRGVLAGVGLSDPFWEHAAVHLFLNLFADGWFVLALLGVAWHAHPPARHAGARWGQRLAVVGLPASVLLTVPVELVTAGFRTVAAAGAVLLASGYLVLAVALARSTRRDRSHLWTLTLGFLGLRALSTLAAGVPALAAWGQAAGLRILYLHLTALGVVTLGLVAAAIDLGLCRPCPGRAWGTAVLLMLASLLPLTALWPDTWGGAWTLWTAAGAAVIPLAPALASLTSSLTRSASERGSGPCAAR